MHEETIITQFKDKKVLVCGASGMTGRNLYEYLKKEGVDVIGTRYDKEIEGLMFADFTKFEQALNLTKDVDYVFITCAKTYNAQTCIENPQSMILPNLQMVSNILEACLQNKVKKVLYVSSATVYQPSFKILAEEEMDWNQNPADIYMGVGWVKRYIEKMCEFYTTLGLNTVVIRPTNIYGKFDKCDEKVSHVVPALIQRALKRENEFTVYGNGLAIKDLIYVDDLIRDMLKVFAYHNSLEPINICSGTSTSIEELARAILGIIKHEPEFLVFTKTPDITDNVPYKRISRAKFDALFGEEKYTPLSKGLEETIKWFC